MCDSEVVDLTLEDGPKPSAGSASQLDLAALAREREARRQSRGDDGGDAKRPRVASTPAAPTGDAPLRAGWFTRSGMARAQQQQITFPCPTVSPRAVLRALRRENLGFYRAIDDKTGELVRPIVSPVVVFENIDGEHGMAIGAALQRLQGDDLSGAAKGSGMHCGVAMGANCGDTYKVMYSHDTEGVESDGGVETYFKALLDSAKSERDTASVSYTHLTLPTKA